jgi:hypothetical protein
MSKRQTDPKYIEYIRSLPCTVCQSEEFVIAHHVLRGVFRGMGRKADDRYTIPLCHFCHHKLHMEGNETEFLAERNLPPAKEIADKIWEERCQSLNRK